MNVEINVYVNNHVLLTASFEVSNVTISRERGFNAALLWRYRYELTTPTPVRKSMIFEMKKIPVDNSPIAPSKSIFPFNCILTVFPKKKLRTKVTSSAQKDVHTF